MTDSIPIQNIYYLLCYAWNKLDEGETIDLSTLESPGLVNLFAHVLSQGTQHLIRRGLDRDYVSFSEETARIRGRVNFPESIKRNLIAVGRPMCEFDEISHNVLHNRILKTTLDSLLKIEKLHPDLKGRLAETFLRLPEVDTVRLSSQIFRRVQLHRNNNYYKFLLSVCELVFENLLVEETSGASRFRDFIRDEHKFRALFEEFVRNFYRLRQRTFNVGAPTLRWNVVAHKLGTHTMLPEMRTDICLYRPDRQILIDCKFSKSLFSSYHGKESLKPAHLYQMYAYLHHARRQFGWESLEGILLYPTVSNHVDLRFDLDGFPFLVRTIDLNQPWQNIESDLTRLIEK